MKPLGKIPKWNSKIAYAIGLITTDGCLSPDGRHIEFSSKDKKLVETFRNCLSLKAKIGRKVSQMNPEKRYYRIQFGDVILYRWLLELGLMPNKSKVIGSLKIPKEYFADFLRGHLDGDGTIRVYQDPIYKNSQRLYITFLSASMKHIQWLHEEIISSIGIKGFRGTPPRIFSLTFAKQESMKLLPYLYYANNVPCLQRKRKRAESFL